MIGYPNGWAEATLGDAVEVLVDHRGQTPGKLGGDFISSGVPAISAMSIKDGRIDFSRRARFVSHQMFERWMPERLRRGDVLMTSEAPLGSLALVPSDDPLVLSQRLFALRGRNGYLDNRYLRWFLASPLARRQLDERSSGSTVTGIRQAELRQLRLPIPPIDHQHRIVDLLEDHLSRLDAADAYLDAAQLRSSVLHDQLLASELMAVECADVPFAELLAVGLANGKSVPTQEAGFPVLRLTALRDGRIDLAERKPGAWTAADARRFLVERGDFLIARGNGSLRLVGRGGLVTDEPDAVAFPDTLIRARPDLNRIHPEFMAFVWNAPGVRRQVEKAAKTTAGIYKVNQKDLGAVRVPVPSLADQIRVTAAVRDVRDALSRLALEVGHAADRSSALRRSLLGAAFSGRLTDDAFDLSEAEEMINA